MYAAETGFLLAKDPDTVRAPTRLLSAASASRRPARWKGNGPGAPDLAVEVGSPGDAYAEVEGKVAEWLRSGARMMIVVDPSNRTVKIYLGLIDLVVLTEDDEIDGADVVPEWRLLVRRLFGD